MVKDPITGSTGAPEGEKSLAVKSIVSVIVVAFASLPSPVAATANAHAKANVPKVIFFMTHSQVVRRSEGSGDFPTPSPPAEKATARQDQAG